jgi:hypothetical protein
VVCHCRICSCALHCLILCSSRLFIAEEEDLQAVMKHIRALWLPLQPYSFAHVLVAAEHLHLSVCS